MVLTRLNCFFTKKTVSTILMCFFCLYCKNNLHAQEDIYKWQDQATVDSLKHVYMNSDEDKNNAILLQIAQNETNPDEKLYYSELLIEKALQDGQYFGFRSVGYLQKGNALQLQGEFHEALSAYFKSLEITEKNNDAELSAGLLVSIADTYSMIGNSESAQKYYDKGLILLRKVNDSMALGSALLNSGDELFKTESYKDALRNFQESGQIFDQLNYHIGKAYTIGNIGMVYAKQGKDESALKNMNEAIQLLEENEDYYAISEFLNYMSDLYEEQSNIDAALEYAFKSHELSNKFNLKDQISNANLQLSELMEKSGNHAAALEYFKMHDIYQDSILNLENVQKMANIEVENKQLEVENLEQKRKNQRIVIWSTVGVLFLTSLLAYGLFKRHKFVKATNKIIAAEKQRSDDLLLNILPEDTAEELKESGRVEAKKYEAVTVFFSDFKGFTKYAENLSPEILVETIDHYFSKFDEIIEKYGLEKIKTIGDAYMAAGGLNYDNDNHAKHMILAAQEMIEVVEQVKHDEGIDGSFDIRIGINTGPVVAGVVGTKKFAYDIWGDTVNIAARMESSSEPGRINISEDTYKQVQSDFDFEFEYRGELEVKNRGHLKMYFVNG